MTIRRGKVQHRVILAQKKQEFHPLGTRVQREKEENERCIRHVWSMYILISTSRCKEELASPAAKMIVICGAALRGEGR